MKTKPIFERLTVKNLISLLTGRPSPKIPVERRRTPPSFHVTLWPAFPHFNLFANDYRLQGIRLNSAMMAASEIDDQFVRRVKNASVPLWFDIKGMQLRIRELVCDERHHHLEFIINRPVKCRTPCPVYFKAGEDCAKLIEIRNGTHFIFEGGPKNIVKVGESIHLKDPDLQVNGPTFLDYELEKIARVKSLGFTKWYLSYVYEQKHVDEFRALIGKDAELILKIENQAGLQFIADKFKKDERTRLMAARGDLFVELEWPHDILNACKTIIEKDPEAFVGSRMLLSLVQSTMPSCSDLNELAWLYDIGFRNFLLCDELCLKEQMLGIATSVFEAFRINYCPRRI